MNIDNNSDPNESLEAPEDDDFGDFEAAEDEAPEAVQAMVGGPNWVYPDLVRIQSSSNSYTTNDSNSNSYGNNNLNNRVQNRVLDPPDVSLLTSNSSKPASSQNTLDLCSSLGCSSNNNNAVATNLSLFNTLINTSSLSNNKNGPNPGPTSASSPSSGSSTSSSSSLAVTNLSGLILSNSSNTSSPSLSQSNHTNNNNKNDMMDITTSNNSSIQMNPIPSTSNGITSSNNLNNLNFKNHLEQRIRLLQIENRLLQDQLCERDKKIIDLQRMGSDGDNGSKLEDSIGRRIENALERIGSNIETSISNLTNRVEMLENKTMHNNNIQSSSYQNGMINNNEEIKTSNNDSNHLSNDLFLQLLEQLKSEQQRERQKLLKILSNILTQALREINDNITFQ